MVRPRILNVDDNEIGRFTVTQMLRSADFDVDEAASGMEALSKAESLPDVILLDVRLPDLDGFEVCRRIKADPRLAGITVVHLSATSVDSQAISHGLNWGADGYLTEPISQAELIATVRAFLRIRQAESAQRLLADASRILSSALEADEVLARLAPLAVSYLGELCVVDKLDEHGEIRTVAAVRTGPSGPVILDRFPRAFSRGVDHGVVHVVASGKSDTCASLDDLEHAGLALGLADPTLLADLMPCSYVSVPLIARSRTLGVLTIVSRASEHRYTPRELPLIEDLAARSALLVDNARLYEQAQKAVAMRENLLAVVSHDLKDPLNSVLMSCEVLHESTTDTTTRRRLDIMRRAARRMDHLIHDLLDLASLDRGMLSLRREIVQLEALIDDLLETVVPQAGEKNIEIDRELVGTLAPVYCDRDRLHQVLANLLGNAIKFTPKAGRIRLRVEQVDGRVSFSVTDNGPGISDEQLPHLFDRFWQAHATSSRTGSGLGLSIAKAIVDAHGGSIRVRNHSAAGTTGSTFQVTLPIDAQA
jgi:signal transduction histidine kinase/DNA-binding NarL/FixJ family response regulator